MYARWGSNGDPRGEEPIEPIQQQMDLYNELKATADPAAQADLMNEILQIAADNFWAMGITLPAPGYTIRKNNFMNTPASYPNAWLYPHPGPTNTFQYYIVGS